MSNAAIVELNDCDARVARDGAIAARSMGIAALKEGRVVLGDEALKIAHLDPRNAFTRFWSNLNQDSFKHPATSIRHNADLAFAHLLALHEAAGRPEELAFAVPGSFTNAQLSLLLGLGEAAPFSVTGLVDAAVAAAAATAGVRAGACNHLDLCLHHATLTPLAVSSAVQRGAGKVVHDAGLLSIHECCANFIADLFIQQARFDPLRHGETERALHQQLPAWLQRLERDHELSLEIQFQNARHRARLHREPLLDALRPLYDKIIGAVDPASQALLSHRLAALPGFADQLPNAQVLDEDAVFRGCRSHAGAADQEQGVYFVTRLEVLASPSPASSAPRSEPGLPPDLGQASPAGPGQESPAGPGQESPAAPGQESPGATHVLVNGAAHPLGPAPRYLRAAGETTLTWEADAPCSVSLQDGQAVLSLAAGAAVFVDGAPAVAGAALRPGATLSVAGGAEFVFIRVLP